MENHKRLFIEIKLVRVHYFNVMDTVMQFLQFFFYKTHVEYLRKHLQKKKSANDFFIAVLFHFYNINLTKS